jgi:hypothetical protein
VYLAGLAVAGRTEILQMVVAANTVAFNAIQSALSRIATAMTGTFGSMATTFDWYNELL